ncbi:N-acetyltransferase [Curtobacterium sp. MCPF17_011]|nr:N-acetyltransferase [Curtobacterium sp. MCPF17_011]
MTVRRGCHLRGSPAPSIEAQLTTLTVVHQSNEHRYVALLDGREVGLTQYTPQEGHRTFIHTEVARDVEGNGVGGALVSEALRSVVDDGLRIVAVCPFVAHFVATHPEFQRYTDPRSSTPSPPQDSTAAGAHG